MQEILLHIIERIIATLNWSYIVACAIGYVFISLATNVGRHLRRWLKRKMRQWRWAHTHPLRSELTNIGLTLLDKEGKRLRYSKGNLFTFNYPTKSYIEALWSEGRVENVFSSIGTISSERLDSGYWHYRVDFPEVYQKGDQANIVFSADFLDSFSGSTEWWTHDVLYDTEKLLVRIVPPQERPILSFAIQKWDGSHWQTLKVRDEETTVAQAIINAPEIGERYRFKWHW